MSLKYGVPFGIPYSPRVTEMGIEEVTPRQYAFKLLRKDIRVIHHLYSNTEPLHRSYASSMTYYNNEITSAFESKQKFLTQDYLFALSQVVSLSLYNNDRPDRKAQHRRRIDLAKHFDVHRELDNLTYWVTLFGEVVLLTLSREVAASWSTRLTILHGVNNVKMGYTQIGSEKEINKFKKVRKNEQI